VLACLWLALLLLRLVSPGGDFNVVVGGAWLAATLALLALGAVAAIRRLRR
jgi:hypothetical protein